jgi:hypothetical protein
LTLTSSWLAFILNSAFSRQASVTSQQVFISSSQASILASSLSMVPTRCSKSAMSICHVGSNPTVHNLLSQTIQSNQINPTSYSSYHIRGLEL